MLKKFKSAAKEWVLGAQDRFGQSRSLRALTMCRQCYTFYYKHSWHFERPDYLRDEQDLEIPVRFTQCQACAEQELAFYDMEADVSPVS